MIPTTSTTTPPQWTDRITDKSVGGEDHLGVEGVAQNYQQYLIPGIITTTDRARYYSFYCWVLDRFIHDPQSTRLLEDFRGTYFRRHEVAFLLACYSHHMNNGGITGLVGNSRAPVMWETNDPISLDQHYFQDKLGGFGQYYRPAMETMGLIRPAENAKHVYRLTHRGKALADAFGASIAGTAYAALTADYATIDTITRADALEYGEAACLCAPTLDHGADREELIEAFFRFDESGIDNPHARRRLTLALLLDMTDQAGVPLFGELEFRRALFLGQFSSNALYQPRPFLADWYTRWRYVQARHTFTTALQALWAVFLRHLQSTANGGLTFADYIEWAHAQLDPELQSRSVHEFLTSLCEFDGVTGTWLDIVPQFDGLCRRESGGDEVDLYSLILANRSDFPRVLTSALLILGQFYLRFYPKHQAQDPIWREIANRERLPITGFMQDFGHALNDHNWTARDLLQWLYRDYILGQHEFMALQKLRWQRYNTFKFLYRESLFYWPVGSTYREPVRYPGLRLFMAHKILSDLGLLQVDAENVTTLTDLGRTVLDRCAAA